MQKILNYINGELVPPAKGRFLDNFDPSTGSPYSVVPDSDGWDVDHAIVAAMQAFPKWSGTPATERSKILLRVADLMEREIENLSLAECVDNGKPLSRARNNEIPRAISNVRFFATAILHEKSEMHPMDREAINYTLRRPRGVAGIISPWNLPLHLVTWKVSPALATGNTVVAKPSEITPMTAFLLSKICIEAGLPPGVLNIVHGTGQKVGAAIVADPSVPTISFTGGTKTGKSIVETAAPLFKKVSLELGGKNANVVFADADFDNAVNTAIQAAFANQGQICLCGSRLLVEQSIYDKFLNRFVARARALRIGDPLDPATEQGAMVSKAQVDKSVEYVELAQQEGGNVIAGGKRPTDLPERCAAGYFFEPTVLTDLSPSCRTNQEEIFGPVVSILPFRDETEAVEIANSTPYGLSASLWTSNATRAHRVADQLQAGTVWVNCWMLRDLRVPFGGVKQSGVGREGGDESMRFFTEPKNVCIKTA